MKSFALASLVTLGVFGSGLAPSVLRADETSVDPFADNPPFFSHDSSLQVRVSVEFIGLSHEKMNELLFEAPPGASDAALRKTVAGLVKTGEAELVETMLCLAPNGSRATAESVKEFVYPSEYEPGEIPNAILLENAGDTETSGPPPALRRNDYATGPTPTAFEARNLGSMLEIEPKVVTGGERVHLSLAPEIVHHVGNQIWAEWKGHYGDSPVQMPTFYRLSVNTTVILTAGEPLLLAALTPMTGDGSPDFSRKLMVFVRADVIAPQR